MLLKEAFLLPPDGIYKSSFVDVYIRTDIWLNHA
jgi:hypothetical protein